MSVLTKSFLCSPLSSHYGSVVKWCFLHVGHDLRGCVIYEVVELCWSNKYLQNVRNLHQKIHPLFMLHDRAGSLEGSVSPEGSVPLWLPALQKHKLRTLPRTMWEKKDNVDATKWCRLQTLQHRTNTLLLFHVLLGQSKLHDQTWIQHEEGQSSFLMSEDPGSLNNPALST